MSKLLLTIGVAMAVSLAAQVAQAARHRVSERIFYADLDLSTPKGARAMLKRIDETAEALCAPERSPIILPPAREVDARRCRDEAVQRAVARLQAPMVTAEYDRIRATSRRMAAAH